jgi:hypothetical protein
MTREQQVPALETCKLLKEAGYPQGKSCFSVWTRGNWENILDDGTTEPALYLGTDTFPKENEMWGKCLKMYDAPTLQELLEELGYAEIDYTDGIWDVYILAENKKSAEYKNKMNPNAAEAAALLWLELRKEVSNG